MKLSRTLSMKHRTPEASKEREAKEHIRHKARPERENARQ